jgi:L-ascorbate metabolism protein UlaG (beta-lactamase superfamily)
MDLKGAKLTWLGHSTFRLETNGKTIYIDPWIMGNPACPASQKKVRKADALLCTHGHSDHIGDAVAIAKQHNPTVVGIYELATWVGKKGAKTISPMNKGGSQTVAGVRVTMTHAVHSCGIQEDDGSIIYGGEACGYVIELENGLKLYHAGDTAVFGDMGIIRDLYAPDIALLPIGDRFTMGPREASYACNLLRPKFVIPMHFGTFPLLNGTPRELKKLIGDVGCEVVELRPGQTISELIPAHL